jgi:multidrug efflux pump subunit AcrA (membrane-fusion protein)
MLDESQVATDQKDLAQAETTLATVLSSLPATTPSSGHTSTGTGTRQGSGTGGSGQTGRTSQSGGTGGTQSSGGSFSRSSSNASSNSSNNSSNPGGAAVNSAQQLASDQATIDSDQAALVRAQQSLVEAQLTSPMAGTVAAVTLQAGQTVTAGSTSSMVQIINPGRYQSTASLTSSQVAAVKVGDTAHVTVDGTSGSLAGVVTRVGPVLVSGSTYSYPVVVALDSGASGIAAGSAGQIQIDLAQADNALVVPTSAVHTTGVGRFFVTVLQAGKPVTRPVTLGVVGATYTQILSGVTRGMTVVLANLSSPVPSSSSNLNSGRFGGLGGAGGFGGRAGLGGGGFPTGAVSRTAVLG